MPRYLAVVERAYRGSLEEQYAHILWLCQMLRKMRGSIGVLLRGNAVLYAQREQRTPALRIGGVNLPCLPQYATAVTDLLADGAEVYAAASDLERLGIQQHDLCAGVRPLSTEEMVSVMAAYDGVWYW